MAERYQGCNQNLYIIEEQTTQWPKIHYGHLDARQRRTIRILSFWSKFLFGKESKLSLMIYRLYFEMYALNEAKFSWLNNAYNIRNE
jgi:hypothetical protein